MHTINYILHNTQLYDQKPPQPRCRCARHNADANVFAGMGWSVVTWRRWLKVVNNLVKRAEGLPFAAICSRWNTYIGFRCSLLVWAVVVSNPTRWTLSIIFGPVYGSSISSGGPQVNREISAAMYWSSSLLGRNVWLLPKWRSVSTSCRNCFQLKHISAFKYDDE